MVIWTAMAEQHPPLDTPILICANDGTVTAGQFSESGGHVYLHGVGFSGYEWDWDWLIGEFPVENYGVTHWAVLPAGPEGQGG